MTAVENNLIEIETSVNALAPKVWDLWTIPFHIIHWNNATDDWHTTYAENDLKPGGKFLSRMEARDTSMGFDFSGVYDEVEKYSKIRYHLDDGRKVTIHFNEKDGVTHIVESFEAESSNPVEMQREGWQAILNNFKKYAENSSGFEHQHYEITINAAPELVYNTIIEKNTYDRWTKPFNPGSTYKGSWKKGSDIQFLGIDENNITGGMISYIKENIPDKFISIQHLDEVRDIERPKGNPDTNKWSGALENYSLIEKNGKTLLLIDLDVSGDFSVYMQETWPEALELLKLLCEKEK